MDRISELPTEVLHQILSLLPTKTATQTALLSKPWLKASSTNSNLCFDESDFGEEGQNNGMFIHFHDRFVTFVDNTLERYRRENLPISAFKLHISFSDQTDCEGLVDKWLDIIAEKKVLQVALLVKSRSGYYSVRYSLLADTIFAIESLQHLELNHCKILKRKTLLSEDKIKCINLKNLTLCYVSVSESAFDRLISCCPQIQTISLQYCISLGCIRLLKNLPNLLSLKILFCPIKEVHIGDAPKMLSFEYVNKNNNICLHMLKIGTCQNLRRVEFVNAEIDDTVLFELIPKLHSIKELILHYCKYLNKIKISSSTLEVCSIERCDYLVQATFDVPKLLSLIVNPSWDLDKRRLPCLSFESASSQCRISIDYGDILNAEQYIQLRRSLVELRNQVVNLNLGYINKGARSSARGIDHLPTPEVENLILYPYYSTQYFDVIFSICWPQSITFPDTDRSFNKHLRQQLLKKRQWRFTKCTWKEYMINAQIEYQKRTGDDWMTLDRKILAADAHIIEEMNAIRFKHNKRKEK